MNTQVENREINLQYLNIINEILNGVFYILVVH